MKTDTSFMSCVRGKHQTNSLRIAANVSNSTLYNGINVFAYKLSHTAWTHAHAHAHAHMLVRSLIYSLILNIAGNIVHILGHNNLN